MATSGGGQPRSPVGGAIETATAKSPEEVAEPSPASTARFAVEDESAKTTWQADALRRRRITSGPLAISRSRCAIEGLRRRHARTLWAYS